MSGPADAVPAGYDDLVVDVQAPDADEPGHPPTVLIYGTPDGLRALAKRLCELADDANEPFPPGEGEHWHLSAEGGPGVGGGLHPLSVPLTLGRLDSRREPDGAGREFEWFLRSVRRKREVEAAARQAAGGDMSPGPSERPRPARRTVSTLPRTTEEKFADWRRRSPISKLFHFPLEVPLWKIPAAILWFFTPPPGGR